MIGGVLFLLCGFFTAPGYSKLIAILFIVIQISMSLLDISAHAIILKELKSKSHTSIIMGYSQTAGGLIGSVLLLKLTSSTFANSVGLAQPITSPTVVLASFGVIIIVISLLWHFLFTETVL
jgi:hypothetical protein